MYKRPQKAPHKADCPHKVKEKGRGGILWGCQIATEKDKKA